MGNLPKASANGPGDSSPRILQLECCQVPLPPRDPRPWYWGADDILFAEAPYGNEWIINKYLLYNHAIALTGPDFRDLTGPVDIREVQKACIRDLFTEWEPKKIQRSYFKESHYESYFVLNLCRILYTVMCGDAGSKSTAASWVKSNYGEPWQDMVATAERWQPGMELNLQEKALEFLDFVIERVLEVQLSRQMASEITILRKSK